MKVYQTGPHEDFSPKDQYKFVINQDRVISIREGDDCVIQLGEENINKEADKLIGEF